MALDTNTLLNINKIQLRGFFTGDCYLLLYAIHFFFLFLSKAFLRIFPLFGFLFVAFNLSLGLSHGVCLNEEKLIYSACNYNHNQVGLYLNGL